MNSVLFVSPYLQDAHDLGAMLQEAAIALVHCNDLKDAAAKLKSSIFSVVLTEASLQDGTWLDMLKLTRPLGTALVVTDAFADARLWAAAINLGAYDLLAQPFYTAEVHRVLTSASTQSGFRVEAAVSTAAV